MILHSTRGRTGKQAIEYSDLIYWVGQKVMLQKNTNELFWPTQ